MTKIPLKRTAPGPIKTSFSVSKGRLRQIDVGLASAAAHSIPALYSDGDFSNLRVLDVPNTSESEQSEFTAKQPPGFYSSDNDWRLNKLSQLRMESLVRSLDFSSEEIDEAEFLFGIIERHWHLSGFTKECLMAVCLCYCRSKFRGMMGLGVEGCTFEDPDLGVHHDIADALRLPANFLSACYVEVSAYIKAAELEIL